MSLPLLHSPAKILAALLINLDVAADPPARPWPVFVGNEPTDPDDCLTLYDTTGFMAARSMIDGELVEWAGWQLRVRAVTQQTGFVKATALRRTMSEDILTVAVALDGTTYLVHCLNRFSGVISLGKDVTNSKRYLFTLNGTMAVSRAA